LTTEPAVPLALAWFTALALAAHSNSQGKSSFALDEDGVVRIEIQLGAPDLPELCNVDLSVKDRVTQEANLDVCLRNGLRYWLRVSLDERACPIDYLAWREVEPRSLPPVIAIAANASCARGGAQMTIDWGLFSSTVLDHTSVAKIEVPGREPALFAFSKRARKVTVPVGWRPSTMQVAIGGALAVAAALGGVAAGVALGRRRRARTSARA
jgi:hypothetical protein